MNHYVYTLLDPITKVLLYIGRSYDPKRRCSEFERLRGIPAQLGPIQRFDCVEAAQQAELKAISKYWPPYNKNLASSIGGLGYQHRTDSKEKIGEASRRRKWKEESKSKISMARKGKPLSSEHQAKLSAAKLNKPVKFWSGKKLSNEHRAKLSASHMKVKL